VQFESEYRLIVKVDRSIRLVRLTGLVGLISLLDDRSIDEEWPWTGVTANELATYCASIHTTFLTVYTHPTIAGGGYCSIGW